MRGGGQPISEFTCLRSKSYCVKFEDWQMSKCKVVKVRSEEFHL